MIRVVLAAALATALLGIALPVAESAERDRNADLATGELQRLADRAGRLAEHNDPVAPGADPAATTVVVTSPEPQFTDGGRVVVRNGSLAWQPDAGAAETVEPPVPVRVDAPIRVTERTRLRLSFVSVDGRAVVRVARARVET